MQNWREYVTTLSPPWLREYWGERFVGLTIGLMGDALSEGATQAVRLAQFIQGDAQPPDALPLLASERRMPRYPAESDGDHRARMWEAWGAYSAAGSEESIIGQFAAAGYANVEIKDAGEWDRYTPGYWSVFWVIIPEGSHSFQADGTWGSGGTWGDGGTWSTNATPEQIATIRNLGAQWKAVQWICDEIIVVVSGEVWSSDGLWGDPGTWGGEALYIDAV